MISYNNINSGSLQACVCRYIFLKTVYNKTIIRFGFHVVLNNQGLGECYQPRPLAGLITLTSTLIIPYIIRKTSLNNCLVWSKGWCIGESPPPPTIVARFQILADSLLCSKRFFSSYMYSSFPLSPKAIIFKFQFDQERQMNNLSVDGNPKCANRQKAGA